jgi:hypothetical protein
MPIGVCKAVIQRTAATVAPSQKFRKTYTLRFVLADSYAQVAIKDKTTQIRLIFSR